MMTPVLVGKRLSRRMRRRVRRVTSKQVNIQRGDVLLCCVLFSVVVKGKRLSRKMRRRVRRVMDKQVNIMRRFAVQLRALQAL